MLLSNCHIPGEVNDDSIVLGHDGGIHKGREYFRSLRLLTSLLLRIGRLQRLGKTPSRLRLDIVRPDYILSALWWKR